MHCLKANPRSVKGANFFGWYFLKDDGFNPRSREGSEAVIHSREGSGDQGTGVFQSTLP